MGKRTVFRGLTLYEASEIEEWGREEVMITAFVRSWLSGPTIVQRPSKSFEYS